MVEITKQMWVDQDNAALRRTVKSLITCCRFYQENYAALLEENYTLVEASRQKQALIERLEGGKQ